MFLLRKARYLFCKPNHHSLSGRGPVKCMVLHPVATPNYGPQVQQYLAQQAIGLAKSLNWSVLNQFQYVVKQGPFWSDGSAVSDGVQAQSPLNQQADQPQRQIKEGDYVYTGGGGKGIYYRGGLIFDMETDSDDTLYDQWKNKLVRESLAAKCMVRTRKITQKLYFTRGKAEAIADHIKKTKVDCVFINTELTPGQIRNLKKLFQARIQDKPMLYGLKDFDNNQSETQWESDPETNAGKDKQLTTPQSAAKKDKLEIRIFDRFSIILQIFAKRAKTNIAKLQIQLNYLTYLKTRLVRSEGSTYSSTFNIFNGDLMRAEEVNLEIVSAKQRRAHAAMSGSGESQLEIQRRQVRDREAKIRREIQDEKAIRDLNRKKKSERQISIPQVALVGYTNAGKSALMNCVLRRNEVKSQDLLFQTLSTTTRQFLFNSGVQARLLDTIGFITNLPHELIESFKTTLEQIEDSTVLIHLVDVSNPNFQHQRITVLKVLKELSFDKSFYAQRMIEVWNKIDLINEEHPNYHAVQKVMHDLELKDKILLISATEGTGVKQMLKQVEQLSQKIMNKGLYDIKYGVQHHFKVLQWLKENANIPYDLKEVYDYKARREYPQGSIEYKLSLDAKTYGKLNKYLIDGQITKPVVTQKVARGMPPPGWNTKK